MKTNKNKKGFTLIELVIVLAILGILVAIIVPSWSYFVRRSRERTANAKAKMVFNACQTEVTRISMKERPLLNIINDPTTDSVKLDATKKEVYMGSGDFFFYWDGKDGNKLDAKDTNPFKADTSASDKDNTMLANGINNINNNGEGTYKVYVNNYKVQSVIYCDLPNGRYKGTYPKMIEDLPDAVGDSIRANGVVNADMKLLT